MQCKICVLKKGASCLHKKKERKTFATNLLMLVQESKLTDLKMKFCLYLESKFIHFVDLTGSKLLRLYVCVTLLATSVVQVSWPLQTQSNMRCSNEQTGKQANTRPVREQRGSGPVDGGPAATRETTKFYHRVQGTRSQIFNFSSLLPSTLGRMLCL